MDTAKYPVDIAFRVFRTFGELVLATQARGY